MFGLRTLLMSFLLIGLLPWGAYGAVWTAANQAAIASAPAVMAQRIAQETNPYIAEQPAPQVKASQSKRCRIATLPGQPCSVDLAILPQRFGLRGEEHVTTNLSAVNIRLHHLTHAPPTAPPRFF